MCTLFANLYVLSTWGPHMVYMGSPYMFYIYIIKCGWLQYVLQCYLTICVLYIKEVIIPRKFPSMSLISD